MRNTYIVLAILLMFALSQCGRKTTTPFTAANLPSTFFDIAVNRDTTIITAKGAIIKLKGGTFNKSGLERVKLEIKEAYTIADMLQAGLTTKSGEELLSSGGMVYINAVETDIVISKPISISIPTNNVQNGMQLYKGIQKSDGTIDWQDPTPLPKQELSASLQNGQTLFNSSCASCHKPAKDATGPPLAFLAQRRDWLWLRDFVHNSAAMISGGDTYAKCIYTIYNKTAMTAFPDLSDDQLKAIFKYADYAAGNTDPSTIVDHKKSVDSCKHYYQLKQYLTDTRDSFIKDNGTFMNEDMRPARGTSLSNNNTFATGQNTLGSLPQNMVNVEKTSALYYQVDIQTFGWYNIDILTKNLPGFENSELMLRITGTFTEHVTTILILPQYKTLLNGGLLKDQKNVYGFYKDDGTIPLPQQTDAYIIATGEYKEQLYFGSARFVTGRSQAPEITLYPITKEQMMIEIGKLDLTDFTATVKDSKHADDIRRVDTLLRNIEKYKPVGCNCNCIFPDTDTASEIDGLMKR